MADSESENDFSDRMMESPMPEGLADASSNSRLSNNSNLCDYSNSDMENAEFFDQDDEKFDESNEAHVRSRANDIAQGQIKKIEKEMKKMHEKHCQLLRDMDTNYAAIEQETHQRYIEFINKWKDQLKQKIEQYRKVIESLNMEVSELKDLNSNSQEIINKAITEKNSILERYNRDISEKEVAFEKEKVGIQEAYNKQIKLIQKEKQDLQMKFDEAIAEKQRLADEVKNLSESLEKEQNEKAQMRSSLLKSKSLEKELKSKIRAIEKMYADDSSRYALDSIIKKIEDCEAFQEKALNLKAEIERLRKKKLAVKKQITQWVQDFESAAGRKCMDTDKEQIKHLYTKYIEKNKKQEDLAKRYESLKSASNSKLFPTEERNPTPLGIKLRSRSPSSNLNVSVDSVLATPLRERERKTPRDESSKEKSESVENPRKDHRGKIVLSSRNPTQGSNSVANNIIHSASSLELQQIKLERDQLKTEVSRLQVLVRETQKDALGPVLEESQKQADTFRARVKDLEKQIQNARSMAEKYKNEYERLIAQVTETQDVDNAEVSTLKSQLAYCSSELLLYRDKWIGSEAQSDLDLMYEKKKLVDENAGLQVVIGELRQQLEQSAEEHMEQVREVEAKSNATVRQVHEELQKSRREVIRLGETDKELRSCKDKAIELQNQLENTTSQYEERVLTLLKEVQDYKEELKDSVRQRKLLHNQLEDLKGTIRVFCRVRPMSPEESSKGSSNIVSISDDFSINVEAKPRNIKKYNYDAVFGPSASQDEVFEDTKRLIQSAVDGFNVCIFAYGQTGSGKTYTIQGYPGAPGIAPRAIDELFRLLGLLPASYAATVSCYMVELHMQNLIDLLRPRSRDAPALTVKSELKGMMYLPGVLMVTVESAEHLKAVYEAGVKNRHVSRTKMNEASSRSHLIFCVVVEVANTEREERTVGKMSFVDLAGSERLGKSEATQEALRETTAINQSLSALGNVINALINKVSHIPYRSNKLTMLMSDSIGGSAKTLMFVNISPASIHREETLTTLFYGTRAKLVINEPTKNVENKEILQLKADLMKACTENNKMKQMLTAAGLMEEKGEGSEEEVDN
jgi:hypothetical protein